MVLLEIFYKVLWLVLVAYPLWKTGTLAGSPAEGTTVAFLWVVLPIVAVPWGFVFATYVYSPKKGRRCKETGGVIEGYGGLGNSQGTGDTVAAYRRWNAVRYQSN